MSAACTLAAAWLLTVAVHAGLWAALALGTSGLLRNRALAWQEALLRLALFAGLLTGTLQWSQGGPWLGLPVLRDALASAAPAMPDRRVAASDVEWPLAPPRAVVPAVAGERAVAAPTPAPPAVAFAVVGSAMGMALCGLLAFALARHRLRARLAGREPEVDARVLAAAAAAARAMGLRQTPHLSRCRGLGSPVAFSLLQPEVCLPENIGELGDAELRALFAHELAHVRRGDAGWLLLGALVHALFPWQLWLLFVRRRLCEVTELRCDAAAARTAGGVAVANCLVQVAAWVSARRPRTSSLVLSMAGRPSLLRRRVEQALTEPVDASLPRPLGLVLAVGLLVLFTAAAPGVAGWRDSGARLASLAPSLPASLPASLAAAPAVAPPADDHRFGFARSPDAGTPEPAEAGADAEAEAAAEVTALLRMHAELVGEGERLAAEAAQLRAELDGTAATTNLLRLLDLLEVRLAAMQHAGARLEAALAETMSDGAPSPARRER